MDKSWSGISDNVNAIHRGQAPDHPGSKSSYFAAMLFANSEVRTLGYYVLDNILKIAATHPEFDLRHLVVLYRELVSAPAEFLGYVGTESLRDSHRKIDELIKCKVETNANQEEAREDLLAVVSVLAQYINPLNAPNLLLFPFPWSIRPSILFPGRQIEHYVPRWVVSGVLCDYVAFRGAII